MPQYVVYVGSPSGAKAISVETPHQAMQKAEGFSTMALQMAGLQSADVEVAILRDDEYGRPVLMDSK